MISFDSLNNELLNAFGSEVVLFDQPGHPVIHAVYSNEYGTEESGAYVAEYESHTLGVLDSSIKGVDINERVIYDEKQYRIVTIRPDGSGWSTLIIEAIE